MTIRAFRDGAGRANARARGLALVYPFIRMVDPPTALPFAGTVVVVRLKDDLVRPDRCRLVRIGHPSYVRMTLHGNRDEFPVRGFAVQVWEDVETEGDEPCTRGAPPCCLTARCGRSW